MMGHLYEVTRDPEGVLSTIPAIATCIAGLLTGKWLKTQRTQQAKAQGMAVFGVLLIGVGRAWHVWFPINKKLWTSSFVVFMAGMALIFLALCYWLADVKKIRGTWDSAILVFGKNAIAAYIFAEALSSTLGAILVRRVQGTAVPLQDYVYSRVFEPLANPANASLLYSLVYVFICWLAMLVLYRKGVFLKV
jgi:predicted acyltransferase